MKLYHLPKEVGCFPQAVCPDWRVPMVTAKAGA